MTIIKEKYIDDETLAKVILSDEVLKSIVSTSAEEVDGVIVLSIKNKGQWINKNNSTKAVFIEVNENKIKVDLSIVLKFGSKIQEKAEMVQNKVKNAIETMTSLKVTSVNVKVSKIVVGEK